MMTSSVKEIRNIQKWTFEDLVKELNTKLELENNKTDGSYEEGAGSIAMLKEIIKLIEDKIERLKNDKL